MSFDFWDRAIPAIRFYYNDSEDFLAPSWSCQSGRLYHIQAPNGCGKTTYLRILMKILADLQPLYLGHHLGMIEEMSLKWHQELYSFKKTMPQQINDSKTVYACSQGEQKKFALDTHLGPAKLWVLDEPFNALDQSNVLSVCGAFEKHILAGGSVIFTDHLHGAACSLPLTLHPIILTPRKRYDS